MFVQVSAKKKLHIDDLLETIILQADVLDEHRGHGAPCTPATSWWPARATAACALW